MLAVFAGAAQAQKCPPPKPAFLLERFTSAECALCWTAQPPLPEKFDRGAESVAIDWIVPSPKGDDAPLSVAALSEAKDRMGRESTPLLSDQTLTRTHPLTHRDALRVRVADGLPVGGYIGLSFNATFSSDRPLPQGLAGYIALVERVPAGEDGSPVERLVVRAVAGPLNMAGLSAKQPISHNLATRVPNTKRPERLESIGWIETKKGRVLAVGEGRSNDCD
jgi:hypothetical protein